LQLTNYRLKNRVEKNDMKKALFTRLAGLVIGVILLNSGYAQNPGDTIVIEGFNYNSLTRDTSLVFSELPEVSYEKVLMMYSMRCHNGEVNTTGGNNNGPNGTNGCGEWDYSCNTYIFNGDRLDSSKAFAPSHAIGGYEGDVFEYTLTPTYNVFQQIQEDAVVSNLISEDIYTVGTGASSLNNTVPTSAENAKSQYLFTASELADAGLSGDIDAIELNVLNGAETAQFFRCKIKTTSKTELDNGEPDNAGWLQVYEQNRSFSPGINRLQFTSPFEWDGSSNIIVEFSYSNLNGSDDLQIEGENNQTAFELYSRGDRYHIFDGANSVVANGYKGIAGNNPRTVEAWIKDGEPGDDIVSWGVNNLNLFPGGKWIMRINDNGKLRVEVANGQVIGNTDLTADDEWHHVACSFQGDSLNDILLFVDGVLEDPETYTGNSDIDVNTNIEEGIDVQISGGHHPETPSRWFNGNIDDVRIWSEALSEEDIQEWMFKKVTPEHPNYGNLELYYEFSEGFGTETEDLSGNDHDGQSQNGGIWGAIRGEDIFKGMELENNRPNISFVSGEYEITIEETIVNDTIQNTPNPITVNEVSSNAGNSIDDEITPADYFEAWALTDNQVFDPDGNLIESISVESDGTIEITELQYWRRRASKVELMSFVTPYGISLDLGDDGKTWTFDVTDFLPLFNGTKRITMERGGQWQEEIDIKFLFIVGTPPRDVLDIKQIWGVDSPNYTDILNENFFEPRDVPTLEDGVSFKVRTAITGHGQEGEFIPQTHWVDVNGGENEFEWEVWKECAENPIYPQGGTWIFDRAGWCPGAPTDLQEFDITEFVTPGETINLDYGLNNAQGTSRYVANHQLVTYGPINHTVDASVLEVRKPSSRVEFTRIGTICNEPEVVIQNNGSTELTSLSINYWVNGDPTPETYEWTGNLEFLEKETVVLPTNEGLVWEYAQDQNNTFHVEIESPNGTADENALNNVYHSKFEIPDVMPSEFLIMFATNSQPQENSYEILDVNGNVVWSRDNMAAETQYNDTLNLAQGCYTYRVYDSDDDGLNFFANNDGNGFTRFKEVGGPTLIFFENDFGDNINYSFTVDLPLSYDELKGDTGLEFILYPNPAREQLNYELIGFSENVRITVFNSVGQLVKEERIQTSGISFNGEIDVNGLSPGIYLIKAYDGELEKTERIIIQ